MQAHAAVFRTGSVLAEGCQKIDDIYNRTEDLKVQCTCDLASNHALVEEIFVENF